MAVWIRYSVMVYCGLLFAGTVSMTSLRATVQPVMQRPAPSSDAPSSGAIRGRPAGDEAIEPEVADDQGVMRPTAARAAWRR